MIKKPAFIFVLILFFINTHHIYAQSDLKNKLEQRRLALQKEISQINKQFLQSKRHEADALDEYNQLKRKLYLRQKLIKNLQKEINYINHQIATNKKKIQDLNKELKTIKKEYAKMIRMTYNSRSRESKLYFLFSSKNFQQAFKRLQYLKQFAKYRQKQALEIEKKKEKISEIQKKLEKDKKNKALLYKDYQSEEIVLKREKQKQEEVVNQIKKKKNKYLAQIKAKQKEQRRLDKMIDELIKKAIAKSNKKAKKTNRSKSKFFLTPEGAKLANEFSQNKGKLPWPVKKAYISRKFGIQTHEIFKNVKINNTGIYLATEPGSKVRAVFKGEVLQIQLIPGGNNTVFIKHGNYLSIYGNLKEVYVKPGEKVNTKQIIGKVATDVNGKTELKFRIYKNMTKLNPANWLYKK